MLWNLLERSLFPIILLAAVSAGASPASFTYQGRILKSDSSPLQYNNVSFQFEITTPNGQCILYREQVDHVDMTNSGGIFDVPIGGGTKSYPSSAGFTLLDAFNNSAGLVCEGGSVYTASSGDIRKLRVKFFDGSGWQTITPDAIVRSVPYAAYSAAAEKIGDKTQDDLVVKADINGNVSCDAGNFLTWNAATQKFGCTGVSGASGGTVTNVSSANAYLTVVNGAATPVLTLNVGTAVNTVAAGNDPRFSDARVPMGTAGGDLGGSYPNPSVTKIRGVGVSSVAPASGQFLKFDGTQWLGAVIDISDVSGLSSTLSGYHTTAAFNTAVGSANCAAYETPYWSSVAGKFLCQSINVSLSGDVSGTIGATSVDKIKGVNVSTTAPTTGEVLKYDGTKWAPAADNNAGGTVTNVTASAPLTVTNGSTTPALSISQANGTTNGYLSSADWTAFNGKQAAGNYVTALTGDVTAAGPGSAAATVAKLQGSTLTLTAPANKDYLKFNGTAFVNSPLAASDLSGAISAANMPAFSGDVTSSAGSTTLTLANAGTAGTYYKVTTDAKGRVTSGASSLIAADIPNLDWSKITSGKPTTLAGYGIGDALVSNAGGSPSIQTGLDASKPASPSAGALYFATDSKVIYQYNSGAWISMASAAGSGGTITGITAGTGLSGGGTTGTVTVNLANTAVTAGSYTRANITVDAQGRITAAANGASVNLGSEVTGILPIANGGTGATTALAAFNALSPLTTKGDIHVRDGSNNIRLAVGTDGQVLTADSTQASGLKWATPTNGTVTNVTGTAPIVVTNNTTTPAISVNAATTSTQGVVQVGAGIAVSSGTITADPANFPSLVPVSKGGTGASAITANGLVAANGTGTAYTSFACGLGQIITFNGSGVAGCSSYNTAGVFLNGGNAFGGTATLGTTDSNALNFITGGSTRFSIDTSGNVTLNNGGSTSTVPMMTIQGGAAVTNNIGLRLYDAGTAINNDNYLEFAHNNGSGPVATSRIHSLSPGGNAASGSNLILETASDNAGTWNSNQLYLSRNGYVGVGTSPGAPLHVMNAAAFENNSATMSGPTFSFWKNRNYAAVNNGDELGFVSFYGHDGTGTYRGAYIASHADAAPASATHTVKGRIEFYTTGGTASDSSERMRIDSNGNVGIGTSSPATKLDVSGSNPYIYVSNTNAATKRSGLLFSSSGTSQFEIGTDASLSGVRNFYIWDNVASSPRMLIDASGNVGVGTSGPLSAFHVVDSAAGAPRGISNEYVTNTSNGGGGLGFYRARGTPAAKTAVTASDGLGYIWATGYTGSGYPLPAQPIGINFYADENWDATHNGGGMNFMTTTNGATNGAIRMTISSSGGVGIGTAAPQALLHVYHPTGLSAGTLFSSPYGMMQFFGGWSDSYSYMEIGNSGFTANNNGLRITGWNGNNMPNLYLSATNTYYTGTLQASSDARLKENIKPIEKTLEKIMDIPGVTFDWKSEQRRKEQGHQVGVIAQDVEKHFPELVREMDNPEKNATLKQIKTVDYSHLSAVVLQAVRELYQKWLGDSKNVHAELASQKRQISSIQEENAHLKQENEALKKRLDAIESKLNSK